MYCQHCSFFLNDSSPSTPRFPLFPPSSYYFRFFLFPLLIPLPPAPHTSLPPPHPHTRMLHQSSAQRQSDKSSEKTSPLVKCGLNLRRVLWASASLSFIFITWVPCVCSLQRVLSFQCFLVGRFVCLICWFLKDFLVLFLLLIYHFIVA